MLMLLEQVKETLDSQRLRAEAADFDYECRFFVGGKYSLANLDALVTGDTYDPEVATNLDGDVVYDDTTITVDSTAGFTTGVILIAPVGDDEFYELVSYTGTTATEFTGCVRGDIEAKGWYVGEHSDGADVTEWFEITDRVRGADIVYELRGQDISWSATLTGQNWNSELMDNDISVLGMLRLRPKDGVATEWTEWGVWFVGFIGDGSVPDDHTQARRFELLIQPISQYVGQTDIPAIQIGKVDLAESKSVTTSSDLEDPYLEANTGEYLGYPDLSGSNAVDSDINTLWISQAAPSPSVPSASDAWALVNEFYIKPPPGESPKDMQWFEVYHKGNNPLALANFRIAHCNTKWTDANGEEPDPKARYLAVRKAGNVKLRGEGGWVVFCYNRAKFNEYFDSSGAAYVIEFNRISQATEHFDDGKTYDFHLDPDGDLLAVVGVNGQLASITWWSNPLHPTLIKQSLRSYKGDPGGKDSAWTGEILKTDDGHLAPGRSWRRYPDGAGGIPGNASNWRVDSNPSPGRHAEGGPEWMMIDLGMMDIHLDGELASGETGDAPLTATLGLTATGYVQINAEIIAYATRDDVDDELVTLTRGQFGTTPATHPDASLVKQYNADDEQSYDLHLVSGCSWKRKRVLDGSGDPIVPSKFEIYTTIYNSPVNPGDNSWNNGPGKNGWEDYWNRMAVCRWGFNKTEWQGTWPDQRVRHILMVLTDMSDSGRAKINEFNVWAATMESLDSSGEGAIDGSRTGGIVKHILVDHFGLDEDRFVMTDKGGQFESLSIARGRAGGTLNDVCRRTGGVVNYQLDGQVEHRYHPMYPIAHLPLVHICWDRDNAREITLANPFRHNVSQVVLRARNPVSDDLYEVRYPPDDLELGSEMIVDDMILGSQVEAEAMAEFIFAESNGPYELDIVPVGPADFVRPGQRHTVSWVLDEEAVAFEDHNFIVVSVNWYLSFGSGREEKSWDTTVLLRELRF